MSETFPDLVPGCDDLFFGTGPLEKRHLCSKSERVGYGLKATAAAGKRAVQVERD